jgi:hypothetical protein
MEHSVLNNYPYALCALRIVRGIKKAGDKEVESIEVETAEYFRCRYFLDKSPFS